MAALEGPFGAVLGHLGGPFERVPSSRGLGGGLRGVPGKVRGALGGFLEAFRRGSRTTRIHWTVRDLNRPLMFLGWFCVGVPAKVQKHHKKATKCNSFGRGLYPFPVRGLQDGPWTAPGWPQAPPRRSKTSPRRPKTAPQAPPGALGSPRMTHVLLISGSISARLGTEFARISDRISCLRTVPT